MGFLWRTLGRTGLTVGPVGLGSSYGLGEKGVEEAFERGCNYLYWGSLRRKGFGRGLRNVCQKDRDGAVVVIQSYQRIGMLLGRSVRRALRKLAIEQADILLLGWWQSEPPARIRDAALRLVDRGLVRHLAVSTHNRKLAPTLAAPGSPYSVVHTRYNAANRGAEEEIFPKLEVGRAGIVAFTATRWGSLLEAPKRWPADRLVPTAGDCYRYALSRPDVDVCLAGPKTREQLAESLDICERGPLDEAELAWMRDFGDAVYGKSRK